MKSTLTPRHGSENLLNLEPSCPEPSMNGALRTLPQVTCTALLAATSLPGSPAGSLPCNSSAGLKTGPSGRVRRRASPSASATSPTEVVKEKLTPGTLLPFSSGSSASVGLQLSLGNRLRQRWEKSGGMRPPASWKDVVTPARRRYCQLAPMVRSMKENGYSGVPTPAARDGKDISRSNAFLSQRLRHSPSLATRLLTQGVSWLVIAPAYCLAMGYPLLWNATSSAALEMPLSRRSPRSSSKPLCQPES